MIIQIADIAALRITEIFPRLPAHFYDIAADKPVYEFKSEKNTAALKQPGTKCLRKLLGAKQK